MRFTGPRMTTGSRKRGLYADASGDGNSRAMEPMERRASPPGHFGLDGRGARLSIDEQLPLDAGGRVRPPLREHGYRLAGTFPPSAADGIVVTRPCVPVACAGTAVAEGAAAAAGIIPSALRTSASSLAIVSLFSFRKLRAFSRPCPMRSPL